MKYLAVLLALAAACGGEDKSGSKSTDEPGGDPVERPAAHKAPSGTIAGKPFAPTHVLLLESSDGAKLGFYAVSERGRQNRQRCDEPMGSDSELELATAYLPLADWQAGKTVELPLKDWSATGVEWNAEPPGSARVTLTVKDAKTFKIAGTIELAGGDWKLSGPFDGEYCPTKVFARDKPEPVNGMAWTLEPVDPGKLPATPAQAIIAGTPAKIAHVTARQVQRHDGPRHELVFLAGAPAEPCAERPRGGRMDVYSQGKRVSREQAASRHDSFSIDLAAEPAAGAALTGNYHHQHGDNRTQITSADLQAFEPDGTRSWTYGQYFSAALAIDAVTDRELRGRVYLALPDQGKSTVVGAFTAIRCPPAE